jgi:hypothetical protein
VSSCTEKLPSSLSLYNNFTAHIVTLRTAMPYFYAYDAAPSEHFKRLAVGTYVEDYLYREIAGAQKFFFS